MGMKFTDMRDSNKDRPWRPFFYREKFPKPFKNTLLKELRP